MIEYYLSFAPLLISFVFYCRVCYSGRVGGRREGKGRERGTNAFSILSDWELEKARKVGSEGGME